MIVITLTDCPPKLRGDLSKWLCEINTGVYVGRLSSRVRDALWERVCLHLKTGRATMVYQTNNEQGLEFRVHNTTWMPKDFDGIKLMCRPAPAKAVGNGAQYAGYSKAAQRQKVRHIREKAAKRTGENYTVIDLETTGLDAKRDVILEIGALRVHNGRCVERFSVLVRYENALPTEVTRLTGITNELLRRGEPEKAALEKLIAFVGKDVVVGYNLAFDMNFLRQACIRSGCPMLGNRCVDVLLLCRRKLHGLPDFRLETTARHLGVEIVNRHRAQADCEMTFQVYQKLMEM